METGPPSDPPAARRKPGLSLQMARLSRRLHRWVGAVLALIMVALSVTGGFVAFKNELEYLQPASRSGGEGVIGDVIAPARVAEIVLGLGLPEAASLKDINRIELRPGKRMYKVRLEQKSIWRSPRELQVDAFSGAILNDGVRGDQLWMDLHSFAVFGEAAKIATMVVSALSLIWLSATGYYMFFYPFWFKANRRRHGNR